jgi:hypothetical protein
MMRLDDVIRNVTDALSGDDRKRRGDPQREESLLDQVMDVLTGNEDEADPRRGRNIRPASEDPLGDPADQMVVDGRRVRPASEDPLGDPADQERYGRSVLPASQDPLGDPADQQIYGRSVLPASQDPLGDPADQLAGRNIRPASEDPLGDPADQPPRGRRRR